ncbi:MAG: efflux RND transporter permease subunit [Candidatus Hydrogenedentes bacterium]|nr:efflux RND transporter permease subunit [Candidatus Hydrogenedentota bacterium]
MTEAQPEAPNNYRLAIRRPVTTAMIFLTMIVFGVRSYQQLPINLMPDMDYPTLTVRTEYEGAAPEVVENLVTRPLEEMLSIVTGLVEISSVSSPGTSEIILEFTWDTDMSAAQQDVRDRLDLFEAPQELTEKPVILRYDPTLDPIMQVAITTPDLAAQGRDVDPAIEKKLLTEIREATERNVKSDLEAKSGIAQVLVKGGQEAEIQVLVDPQHVKSLGLSMEAIGNSLAQQNISRSSGSLKEGKSEYLVRTYNEFETVEDIRESIITSAMGRPVRLADVAEVFMGTKEVETIVRINGREAVALEIYKEGDANTVDVCNMVKDLLGFERELGFWEKIIKQVKENVREGNRKAGRPAPLETLEAYTLLDELPDGTGLTLISDQSRFIQGSIDEVKDATIMGGILALIVLFLFLREMKSTIIIGVAIPISVVATFVPLFAGGVTLNIMSLGGLALGVGMLVDNSIVVLESIFRCREEGDSPVDAAERGTREVSGAVIASTLTTVCVFFPVTFVEGVAGQLFGDLALTVSFSLLASLLTALYLIPLVVSRQGLKLERTGQVFWATRAYDHLRGTEGRGRVAAALGVFPLGFTYARGYFVKTVSEAFVPLTGFGARWREGGASGKLICLVGLPIMLPFLIALCLLQLVLGFLGGILATGLFVVLLNCYAVYAIIRAALRVILWLPLEAFDLAYGTMCRVYRAVLEQALRFSPVILLLTVLGAAHALQTLMGLGSELIPPMKQGEFHVRLEARAGTRIEQTELRARELEKILRADPDVDRVTVEVGEEGTRGTTERGENVAEFTVMLRDPERLALFQDEIIERLRPKLVPAPGEEVTFQLPSLFSFKTAIELQIVGDDLVTLRTMGEKAIELVSAVPGVKDAELSVKSGFPEIIISPDRLALAKKGLSTSQVASRVQSELQGDVPTRFSLAGEKIDIRVRADKSFLKSKSDLRQLNLTEGLASTPLDSVTLIQQQEGPSEIRRVGQRRTVVITANLEGRDLAAVSRDILTAMNTMERPQGYLFELGGQNRELETSYESLRFALLLAIFLVYVVMACQFESMWHPAIVMFSVPLAFFGVAYALKYMGIDLSIMVFLGGIILAGIVVNNAIVLVDYINQLRERGYTKHKAIVESCAVRLRPILMTTITTVLGLLPMIVASGEGAEMRRPLAVTVMFGLSSATLLTLFIIPMIYYLVGGRDKVPAGETPAS